MALINTTTTGVLGSTFFGDGTGSLTIQQNGVTLGVFGNIPAFSAYQSTQQTGITATTWTKINFDIENFDTNNNFASNRFTPTVAGYYQLSASVCLVGASSSYWVQCAIYKNGSIVQSGGCSLGNSSFYPQATTSGTVYLNGTTDYAEIYSYGTAGGSWSAYNTSVNTWFNGILIKAT